MVSGTMVQTTGPEKIMLFVNENLNCQHYTWNDFTLYFILSEFQRHADASIWEADTRQWQVKRSNIFKLNLAN